MLACLSIPITADYTSIAGTFCVTDHHQHGYSLNTILTTGWENQALVLGLTVADPVRFPGFHGNSYNGW